MKKINFLSFVVIFLLSFTNCAQNLLKETATTIEAVQTKTKTAQTESETPEEKAIRLAEEFIKRNGYTEASADKENLSHETVEFYDNQEELLKQRYNSLKPKAYGISAYGRGNEKG